MVSTFDLDATEPEWALGYRFDVVLRGPAATPFEDEDDEDELSQPLTPSQTVGPFYAIGLPFAAGPYALAGGAPGRDLAARPGHRRRRRAGPGRAGRDLADRPAGRRRLPGLRPLLRPTPDGRYAIRTRKPGPVPGPDGTAQAPHLDVSVFARGLLDRVVTRVYFGDEAAANAADPVLALVPDPADRATLIATPTRTGTSSTSGCRERVRPFSSRSEPAGLFDGTLARGGVRAAVADGAWLAALLEVEAALARAAGAAGVIRGRRGRRSSPPAPAPGRSPIAELSAEAAASGNPVVPLVARLRAAAGPDLAPSVHIGATSQDILDTASMLLAARALAVLLADLRGAADAAAGLARTHRDTPMAGRTLLQQAVPTTFGLKAAGWMVALDEAADRLAAVRATRSGRPVRRRRRHPGRARRGRGRRSAATSPPSWVWRDPVLPWHTDRTRVAELAGALGAAAGVVAKVARDVTLLAQNEVAEVAEGAPGGSSTMAHKRNPVAAVSALAGAAQAPGTGRHPAGRDGAGARTGRRRLARASGGRCASCWSRPAPR